VPRRAARAWHWRAARAFGVGLKLRRQQITQFQADVLALARRHSEYNFVDIGVDGRFRVHGIIPLVR
jgi:hypothetical protein